MYYEINEETARRAKQAYSMSDYIPGSDTAEYRAAVDNAAALVEAQKSRVSPYYHDKLDALLDTYARRLAKWYNDHNANTASCLSVLICGPANFPTRKKARQNARDDALMNEYNEIRALLDKIRTVGKGPVDLADPYARELLTEQLQKAQQKLDAEKAANAYYRKHKTLDGCPGIDDKTREWLTRPGVYNYGDGTPLALHGCPFPSFELASARGKVKRLQARLAELDKLQAQQQAPTDDTTGDGWRIVRNAEQNRLQILFDDIPDADTRAALKNNGFRWSPRNKAWQRQLTPNAERAAKAILGL